jgi:hypothetical protein
MIKTISVNDIQFRLLWIHEEYYVVWMEPTDNSCGLRDLLMSYVVKEEKKYWGDRLSNCFRGYINHLRNAKITHHMLYNIGIDKEGNIKFETGKKFLKYQNRQTPSYYKKLKEYFEHRDILQRDIVLFNKDGIQQLRKFVKHSLFDLVFNFVESVLNIHNANHPETEADVGVDSTVVIPNTVPNNYSIGADEINTWKTCIFGSCYDVSIYKYLIKRGKSFWTYHTEYNIVEDKKYRDLITRFPLLFKINCSERNKIASLGVGLEKFLNAFRSNKSDRTISFKEVRNNGTRFLKNVLGYTYLYHNVNKTTFNLDLTNEENRVFSKIKVFRETEIYKNLLIFLYVLLIRPFVLPNPFPFDLTSITMNEFNRMYCETEICCPPLMILNYCRMKQILYNVENSKEDKSLTSNADTCGRWIDFLKKLICGFNKTNLRELLHDKYDNIIELLNFIHKVSLSATIHERPTLSSIKLSKLQNINYKKVLQNYCSFLYKCRQMIWAEIPICFKSLSEAIQLALCIEIAGKRPGEFKKAVCCKLYFNSEDFDDDSNYIEYFKKYISKYFITALQKVEPETGEFSAVFNIYINDTLHTIIFVTNSNKSEHIRYVLYVTLFSESNTFQFPERIRNIIYFYSNENKFTEEKIVIKNITFFRYFQHFRRNAMDTIFEEKHMSFTMLRKIILNTNIQSVQKYLMVSKIREAIQKYLSLYSSPEGINILNAGARLANHDLRTQFRHYSDMRLNTRSDYVYLILSWNFIHEHESDGHPDVVIIKSEPELEELIQSFSKKRKSEFTITLTRSKRRKTSE